MPSTDRSWLITTRPTPEVADQAGEQVEHLRLHHHVERGGRLVGDDQPRAAGQRHRDHDALLLAAGELVRVRRREPRPAADLLEQLADPRVARRAGCRPCVVQQDRLGDLPADLLHRVERVQRALEDDRRLGPAHRAQPAERHRQHVLAVEQHPPGRPSPSAGHQPQHGRRQRRLAAARLAGDAEASRRPRRSSDTPRTAGTGPSAVR